MSLIRRIFSSSSPNHVNQEIKKTKKTQHDTSDKLSNDSGNVFSTGLNTETSEDVQRNVDRELLRFQQPKTEMGMSDHIIQHQRGQQFKYVVVTDADKETDQSVLDRLLNFKPTISKKQIDIGTIERIPLIKNVEDFDLDMALQIHKEKSQSKRSRSRSSSFSKPYIHLSEVMFCITPTVSVYSDFSNIIVQLIDSRYGHDSVVQESKGISAWQTMGTIAMDYSIPLKDISQIKLVFQLTSRVLKEGFEWAAVQLQLKVSELDFPIQTSKKAVTAYYSIPQSIMTPRTRDPNKLDMTIDNTDFSTLQTMFKNGDIRMAGMPIVTGRNTAAKAATLNPGKGAAGSDNSDIIDDIEYDRDSDILRFQEGAIDPNDPSISKLDQEFSLEGNTQDEIFDSGVRLQLTKRPPTPPNKSVNNNPIQRPDLNNLKSVVEDLPSEVSGLLSSMDKKSNITPKSAVLNSEIPSTEIEYLNPGMVFSEERLQNRIIERRSILRNGKKSVAPY
jgi:hypothetical protein